MKFLIILIIMLGFAFYNYRYITMYGGSFCIGRNRDTRCLRVRKSV